MNGESVNVYGDGKNIRDWIYVNDNCEAIELVFKKGITGQSYNICSKFELSNLKLIEFVYSELKHIDVDLKINHTQDRYLRS